MRIIIAGGGTAGHIYPGIALAKRLVKKQDGVEILFIGTEKGMESRIIPQEGFQIEFIRVSGFQRKIGLEFFSSFQKMFEGYADAKAIIKRFQPDIVIGMGGYVCGPVLFCASRMKIPTLIHEQNAVPGVTNKLLARFVDTVCISFEESRQFFKSARYVSLTGNPVREELLTVNRKECREKMNLTVGDRLVVVMGGSLGAEKINETMVSLIQNFYQSPIQVGQFSNQVKGYRLLFATGEGRYEAVLGQFAASPVPVGVEIRSFIHNVAEVFAAADLIICRAGAITLSELAVMGLPSILIPSPNVTANHQEKNALTFQKQGAAFLVLESNLSAAVLSETINDLLGTPAILARMSKQAFVLAKPGAVNQIIEEIMALKRNGRYRKS